LLSFDAATQTYQGTAPEKYVGTIPVRLDVGASVETGLPAFSIIHNVVIDSTIDLVGGAGFSVTTYDELIDLVTPLDFNGSFAIEYTARDTKGAVSTDPAIIVINVDPQPEVPIAQDDGGYSIPENGTVDILLSELLANDSDGDNDPIHVISFGAPNVGSLVITIPELSVDLPPVAGLGSGAVHSALLNDGSPLPGWLSIDASTGRLFGTPPMALLASFAIVVTSTGSGGTFTTDVALDVDGNDGAYLTFTADNNYSGPVFFTYEISDDLHGNDTALVNITVEPSDEPPVAVDDVFDGIEDTNLQISVADLLSNDTDVDNDVLELVSVLNAVNGSVSLVGGTITFVPDHNFDGQAGFEYVVTDNIDGSDTGNVIINVASTNRAPVAELDQFVSVEDTPIVVTIAELLANDSDADGDTLIFEGIVGDVIDGSVTILPDGSLSIVGRENFNGELSITYQIGDGRLSSSSTANLLVDFAPVNDAPDPVDDGVFVTAEDVAIAIDLAGLLTNDTDIEGDVLSFVRVLDPVNGLVEVNGSDAIFTPRVDYFGNAGFSYEVTDGNGGFSIAFVEISVTPNQDLPTAVSDSGWQIDEDSFIDIDPAELLLNDIDPDGDLITFVGASGQGVSVLADGTIRFTPDANDNGIFTRSYSITDGSGINVSGSFTVEVLPINDDPEAFADIVAGVEDQALIIPLASLLGNDRDVDGQSFAITGLGTATGGSVSFDGAGNIIFVPEVDRNTDASFDYTITDITGAQDSATVTVTLAPVNDAPEIATINPLYGTEDIRFVGQLEPSLFSDIDGDALSLEVRTAGGDPIPAWLTFDGNTNGLFGDPPTDFEGVVALEVVVDDGSVQVVRGFQLVIDGVNDAPVAADDLVQGYQEATTVIPILHLLHNDFDVDGDFLSITNLTQGAGYTAVLDGVGNVIVTRTTGGFGDLSFDYTVSDGTLTDTATATITLSPVNDWPVVRPLADVNSDEDAIIDFVLPVDFASDPDGDALTITATRPGGAALPAWLSFDAATSRFSGTPPQNFAGVIAISVTAFDGALASTSEFDLIIDPVNDAPVLALPFSDRFVDEDVNFNIQLQNGLFSDPEGDPLSYEITLADGSALPVWLTADTQFLRLIGVPPADFNGVLDLRITASDGAASISDVFALTINSINDAPFVDNFLPDIPFGANELLTGDAFSIDIPASTFADADGDPLALAALLGDGSALPDWMSFNGSVLTGVAPESAAGVWEIQILASDGQQQASDVFNISFEVGNYAPIAVDDGPFSTRGEVPITIDSARLLANDSDADGDALSIVSVVQGAHGSVSLAADGKVTYTAESGFIGNDEFIYRISDGKETAEATVSVEVGAPFDAFVNGTTTGDVQTASLTGDTLVSGGAGNDFQFGFFGNDQLNGGAGNDFQFAGLGNDKLFGNIGNDFLSAGGGNDQLFGGKGNDRMFGGSGNDLLKGGDGRDYLNGGAGRDWIIGGKGDDVLFGGKGRDVFVFRTGDGSDAIMDYEVPKTGRKFNIDGDEIRLSIEGVETFDQLMAVAQEQDGGVLFSFGDGDELFLSGTQLSSLDKSDFTFF